METFFFISLGITFILILLLVYHFKQRLSTLEQKSDTMFDIINNVVKEMMVIKTMASANHVAIPGLAAFMQNQRPLNEVFSENKEISLQEPKPDVQEIYLDKDQDESEYNEDDDESDDSTDIGESHSEDDDGDSVDSNNDNEDEDREKILVSDDDDEPVNILSEVETLQEEEIQDLNQDLKVVEMTLPVEEPVVVNKVETLVETEVLIETDSKDPMEEYRKLGTSALKTLVVSKGLATDVSKLKKNQLLAILEKDE
jgi:hypothetical protein